MCFTKIKQIIREKPLSICLFIAFIYVFISYTSVSIILRTTDNSLDKKTEESMWIYNKNNVKNEIVFSSSENIIHPLTIYATLPIVAFFFVILFLLLYRYSRSIYLLIINRIFSNNAANNMRNENNELIVYRI